VARQRTGFEASTLAHFRAAGFIEAKAAAWKRASDSFGRIPAALDSLVTLSMAS
jgi:hypothetical protein